MEFIACMDCYIIGVPKHFIFGSDVFTGNRSIFFSHYERRPPGLCLYLPRFFWVLWVEVASAIVLVANDSLFASPVVKLSALVHILPAMMPPKRPTV